jgi:glycerol-3-phosphate dehydrogenase (NAD(P)+)
MAESVAVIGAGAWGTALALLLADKGTRVTLWMYEKDLAEEAENIRENRVYLPGYPLPRNITVTSSLEAAAKDRRFILSVVPSHTVRSVSKQFAPLLAANAIIVNASKGIETETLKPIADVLKDTLPSAFHDRLCFLSGPSFAKEVAKKMPTAVALASYDPEVGKQVQRLLSSLYFRVYTNSDVIGVELGGSVKNVIAIAAGVLEGLGFGHNTMAALITRGLAEMSRLGEAMGANPATFSGLAGMGDLVLTCTGDLSRNRTLGVRLGKGERFEDIMKGLSTVAEGVKTAKATRELARKHGVEMPVVDEVYRIIYEKKDPRLALQDLMGRELREE